MAIQWSEEQLKAIHTVNHNILVSASAGAGKTTVLVARLMKRMLQDHISIDRIVAMTFTEAAASEMKKRLLQSLNDKLQEPNLSEAEAPILPAAADPFAECPYQHHPFLLLVCH